MSITPDLFLLLNQYHDSWLQKRQPSIPRFLEAALPAK
jgi:hypothetical protein